MLSTKPVTPPPATPAADRLAPRELCAYGAGIVAYQYPNVGLGQLAMPLFNVSLGVAPATVGAILMVGRIWDGLINPWMGAVSDNTRSRWGRRRPWLFGGAIFSGILYPLVWLAPRGWDATALGAWLLVSTILLYTAFALYSVPYMALGYELTPDTSERTRVQAWRTYFNLIPSFTAGWFYWFCLLPQFGDAVVGARWLGLIVGVVIVATGVIPALFLRERYYRVAKDTAREPFWPSARAAIGNRPFLIVMGIIVTLTLGVHTTDALGFYICTYHIFGGDTAAAAKLMGIAGSVTMLAAFVAIPLVRAAERRFGKPGALRLCLWSHILISSTKWWLASPAHPWTFVVVGIFAQFSALGFWMLVNSMKGDVCDHDEVSSGRRREGMFGALGNLLAKLSGSTVYFLAGLILQAIGFSAALHGAQNPETMLWMRVIYSGGPVITLSICLWLLGRYPLDGPAMARIRATLETRRAAV